MTEKPAPIRSGTELKWGDARKAAEMILKQCNDAGFTPPEAVDIHQQRVGRVCFALDAIVSALRILRPDPERAASAEIEKLRADIDRMRPVVDAACAQFDRDDDDSADVFAAVAAYRATRETP